MMHAFKPGKLLVSMVGRHKGEFYVSVTKAAGARGGTMSYGRSVSENRFMQALSLADVQQEIVFTLLGEEADRVIAAVKQAAHENPKKLSGKAIVVNVPDMQIRVNDEASKALESQKMEKKPMESGNKLITVIVNNGFADDVMVAARKAGASGGTIMNARGTGTEEDVRFFGISIVPEKEMLLIVADKSKVKDILDAVNATPHLCEPGGGIVYTMDVEEFFILGQ